VAVLVALAVVADLPLAAGAPRYDGHGSGLAERAAQRISIIALVGKHVARPAHAGEQLGRGGHVGDVAGRQHQREGATNDVGERVDLGCPAAARAADRLRFSPLLPPNAARCALTYVLSMAVLRVTAPASTRGHLTVCSKLHAKRRAG